jgi:hypothetical protein
MSYDRANTELLRQCIIVGTTNDEKFLRDQTGNRRYWPVRGVKFDLKLKLHLALIIAAGMLCARSVAVAGAGCVTAQGVIYSEGARIPLHLATGYQTRTAVPVYAVCRNGRWITTSR